MISVRFSSSLILFVNGTKVNNQEKQVRKKFFFKENASSHKYAIAPEFIVKIIGLGFYKTFHLFEQNIVFTNTYILQDKYIKAENVLQYCTSLQYFNIM